MKTDEQYRIAAKKIYEDAAGERWWGSVEILEDAEVAHLPGGAFVAARVWVRGKEAGS